jgi:hypothetical protein
MFIRQFIILIVLDFRKHINEKLKRWFAVVVADRSECSIKVSHIHETGTNWLTSTLEGGLCAALPALAANAVEVFAATRKAVRVGTIAILHTFNSQFDFNSHVHVMTSAGGLHQSSGAWIPTLYYRCDDVMRFWREAMGPRREHLQQVLSPTRAGWRRARLERCGEPTGACLRLTSDFGPQTVI